MCAYCVRNYVERACTFRRSSRGDAMLANRNMLLLSIENFFNLAKMAKHKRARYEIITGTRYTVIRYR